MDRLYETTRTNRGAMGPFESPAFGPTTNIFKDSETLRRQIMGRRLLY